MKLRPASEIIESLIALLVLGGMMMIGIAAVIGVLTDPYGWIGIGMIAAGAGAAKLKGMI